MKYATYNQKDYHLNIRNDMLRLRSNTPDPGFQELIDLGGNKHPNLYIKVVAIEEVNFAYELDFFSDL
ncbi:hypothetical protein RCO48_02955 [Peribacillus frigoritolerans]|nr:hypothetical protein [Peribacillus frigoritolerans]